MSKKKALILVADGFQDEEFCFPYYRLKEDGWHVDVFPGGKGKYGMPAKAEGSVTIAAWDLPWELLIIPGGWQSPELVRQMQIALSVVRGMAKLDRCVAAICHGPQVLISAGILPGRVGTCYKGMKDDLANAGCAWKDEPVVTDGNIVTAQHYRDNGAFMKAVFECVEALKKKEWREVHAV